MPTQLESLPDEELARLSQDGSLAAFEQLVHRYEARIFRFVAQSCRNDADAAEVTQDTFLRAFHAIAQFQPGRPFAPWLFAIARRKCIDHHRAQPPAADELPAELAADDDPAELLARREDRLDLWRIARQCLSPAQFDALWLRYVEGMDVADTARALRRTQTYTKVLLFRARHRLGRELRQRHAAPDAALRRPGAVTQVLPTSPLNQAGLSLR
jgi:RNA polymerase sigma factor (sigma-70 family)